MSEYFSDNNGFVRVAGTLTESGTQTFENLNATGTVQAGTTVTAGTALVGASLSVSGLTGSVVASRYVGQTASGAPASGAHLVGDFVTTTAGEVFVCSVSGTPGTWIQVVAGSLAALALTNGMVSASAAIAVSKLAAGLAGQVLQGTTPSYAYPPGFEIAYDQITSGVNVAATSEGTPTSIIAGTSHTYENVPYIFEFNSPEVVLPSTTGGTVTILLMQDSSSIGRICTLQNDITGGQSGIPVCQHYRFTPSAAAHTYGISAFCSATTGTPAVSAGAAGSGVLVPAFLRVTKV
jgi:hypothetical protein